MPPKRRPSGPICVAWRRRKATVARAGSRRAVRTFRREVAERIHDLLFGVHHEGPVLHHGSSIGSPASTMTALRLRLRRAPARRRSRRGRARARARSRRHAGRRPSVTTATRVVGRREGEATLPLPQANVETSIGVNVWAGPLRALEIARDHAHLARRRRARRAGISPP